MSVKSNNLKNGMLKNMLIIILSTSQFKLVWMKSLAIKIKIMKPMIFNNRKNVNLCVNRNVKKCKFKIKLFHLNYLVLIIPLNHLNLFLRIIDFHLAIIH